MGMQGKWLQVVDGNLAIKLLPFLDGGWGGALVHRTTRRGGVVQPGAPGKRIGRPPCERAGRIIINLVARGRPAEGRLRIVGIGYRMTQLRLSKISNIEGPEVRLEKREKRQGV